MSNINKRGVDVLGSDYIRRAARRIVQSENFITRFAELLATELQQQLRSEAGGEYLYIAKRGGMTDKEERNKLIKASFTGNNIKSLSKKFGLTEQHIRRICKNRNIGD